MTDSYDHLAIPAMGLRTIAVDFDGVIHQYSRGIHDGTCYDPPTDGALSTVAGWMRVRPVAVMTARPLDMVAEWFGTHAPLVPLYVDRNLHREWWDELGTLLLTNRKIVAQHYIDDRAIRFDGWRNMTSSWRTMAGEWEHMRAVVALWDEEYRIIHRQRAMEAEPCD